MLIGKRFLYRNYSCYTFISAITEDCELFGLLLIYVVSLIYTVMLKVACCMVVVGVSSELSYFQPQIGMEMIPSPRRVLGPLCCPPSICLDDQQCYRNVGVTVPFWLALVSDHSLQSVICLKLDIIKNFFRHILLVVSCVARVVLIDEFLINAIVSFCFPSW